MITLLNKGYENFEANLLVVKYMPGFEGFVNSMVGIVGARSLAVLRR